MKIAYKCNVTGDYDIDLHKLALNVDEGHSIGFLCEGCYNRAIYKDEEGKLYILRKDKLHPVNFDDVNSISKCNR